MSDSSTKDMPHEFAKWISETGIEITEDMRDARWVGTRANGLAPDRENTEALIRLAFKSKQQPASDDIKRIREVFQGADSDFPMYGNDRELQILAGAALFARMRIDDQEAAETALMVTTASFADARKPALPMDLRGIASQTLTRLADHNRKRPDLDSFEEAESTFDVAAMATKITSGDPTSALKAIQVAIGNVAEAHAESMKSFADMVKIQDEELQMLWWLIGESSRDTGARLDSIPELTKPFQIGKELADMTVHLPGPRAIPGLLARVGIKDKGKFALPDAINALEDDWIRTVLANGEFSPVTAPLHFALSRRLETGAGDDWVNGWQAAVGITKPPSVTALTVASLFYQERLIHLFGG